LFPTCSIQIPNGFPSIPPFFNEEITEDDTPPNSLKDSNASLKVKTTEKKISNTLFSLQHFEDKKGMLEL
jgi:hypothetical protein